MTHFTRYNDEELLEALSSLGHINQQIHKILKQKEPKIKLTLKGETHIKKCSYFTPPKTLSSLIKYSKQINTICPSDVGISQQLVFVFTTNQIYIRVIDGHILTNVIVGCQEVQTNGWATGKVMWLETNNIDG